MGDGRKLLNVLLGDTLVSWDVRKSMLEDELGEEVATPSFLSDVVVCPEKKVFIEVDPEVRAAPVGTYAERVSLSRGAAR